MSNTFERYCQIDRLCHIGQFVLIVPFSAHTRHFLKAGGRDEHEGFAVALLPSIGSNGAGCRSVSQSGKAHSQGVSGQVAVEVRSHYGEPGRLILP